MLRGALAPFALAATLAPAAVMPPPARAQAPDAPPAYEAASGDPVTAGFDLADLRTPGALTLAEVDRRAVATAPSVARAEAAVRLANAGADQAYVALFPRVDASFSYTRLFNIDDQSLIGDDFSFPPEFLDALRNDVTTVGAGGRPADEASARLHTANLALLEGFATAGTFPIFKNRYAFNAQLSWPVSASLLEVLPNYEAAQYSEEASAHQADAERATIALRAREAYYAYARAVGARVVAESSLAQIRAQREDIRVLVEAGSAAPVELQRADALVASIESSLAQARGGVRVAAVSLRVLLHDPELASLAQGTGIGEDLTTLPAPVEGEQEALVRRALDQRSEVQALLASLRASDLQVRAANGGKVPVVAIAGAVNYENPNQLIIPQRQEFIATYSITASVSWSPNDFFDADARASQASARAMQAEADLAALQDAVRLEVTQAYENYVTAIERYEAQVVGIRAAEETYRVRREQLAAGTVVQTDLIQAESELTSARLDLLNAAIDAHVADAQLRRALDELP